MIIWKVSEESGCGLIEVIHRILLGSLRNTMNNLDQNRRCLNHNTVQSSKQPSIHNPSKKIRQYFLGNAEDAIHGLADMIPS
jgi:hypothetical protein